MLYFHPSLPAVRVGCPTLRRCMQRTSAARQLCRSLLERFIKVAIYFTPPPSRARGLLAIGVKVAEFPNLDFGTPERANCATLSVPKHGVAMSKILLLSQIADKILCYDGNIQHRRCRPGDLAPVAEDVFRRGREMKKLFKPRALRSMMKR